MANSFLPKSAVALLLVAFCATSWAQTTPQRIAGDVITFDGGQKDANEDIYVVEMGIFEMSKTYSITVRRPKGIEVNYAAQVEWQIVQGSLDASWSYNSQLIFEPGETEKTLSFKPNAGYSYTPRQSLETAYLFFNYASRTKVEYPVVQLNFQQSVTPGASVTTPFIMSHWFNENMTNVGSYLLITERFEQLFSDVTAGQKLRMNHYLTDHTAFNVAESDNARINVSVLPTIFTLAPREIGAVCNEVTFLYKVTEEAIITDKFGGFGSGCLMVNIDSLTGIKAIGSENMFTATPYFAGGGNSVQANVKNGSVNLPPRFGAFSLNKTTFDGGETVTLTIPFLNWKVYQKTFNLSESTITRFFRLTLDGGATFIPTAQMTFSASTGNITASFAAPGNLTATDTTIYAEIMVQKPSWSWDDGDWAAAREYYPADAFTFFTVTTETAGKVYTDSLKVGGLPAQLALFNGDATTLTYQVFPVNSSFLTCSWESLDPAIAEINAQTGVITIKSTGAARFRLTSEEVAFRTQYGMPANDEALVREFTINFLGDRPTLTSYGTTLSYSWGAQAEFTHNLTTDWSVAGHATLTQTHFNTNYGVHTESIEIDTSSVVFKDGKKIVCNLFFDDATFPKIPSPYAAGSTADVSIPLQHACGVTYTLTGSSDVYVYQPSAVIENMSDAGTEYLWQAGQSIDLGFTLKNLAQTSDFTIGYTLKKSNGTVLKQDTYTSSQGAAPAWLILSDDGHFRKGVASISCQLAEPASETEEYTVEVSVANAGVPLWEKQPSITRRFSVVSPSINYYQGYAYVDFQPVDINTLSTLGLDENLLAGYANAATKTDSKALRGYLRDAYNKSYPQSLIFRYPKAWGDVVVDIGADKPDTLTNNGFLASVPVSFPMDGKAYSINVSWPKTGQSKTYTFNARNMRNQFYGCNIGDLRKDISGLDNATVYYVNGRGERVSRSIDLSQKILYFYEPDSLSIQATDYLEGSTTVGDIFMLEFPLTSLSFSPPTAWLDKPQFAEPRWTEVGMGFGFLERMNYVDNYVKIVDEKGEAITTAVTVNYWEKDDEANVTSVTTPVEDGLYKLNTALKIEMPIVEITAEGYYPLLVDTLKWRDNFSRGSGHTFTFVMKQADGRKNNYSNAYLTWHKPVYSYLEPFEKTDMNFLPLNGVSSYSASLDPELFVSIAWAGDEIDFSAVKLQGKNARPLAPTATKFIGKNAQRKNNWVKLTYKLTDFLAYEAQTFPSLVLGDSLLTALPGVKNIDHDLKGEEQNLSGRVGDGGFGDPYIDNSASPDMDDTEEAFGDFDITLPSGLPFTFRIEKRGYEYIIRGYVEANFFPGNQVTELVETAASFDQCYNDCYDALRGGYNKYRTESEWAEYEKNNNYFNKLPFIGIKGFASAKGVFNPVTGDFDISFNDAGVQLEVSGELSYKMDCFIAEFGLSISGLLRTTMMVSQPSVEDIKQAINNTKIDFTLQSEAQVFVKAWLSAGFDIWILGAKVGITGGAGAGFTNKLLYKPYLPGNNVLAGNKISLRLFLKMWTMFKLMGIETYDEYYIVDWTKDFYFPDNSSNPLKSSRQGLQYAGSQVQMPSPLRSSPALQALNGVVLSDVDFSAQPLYVGDNEWTFLNRKVASNYDDDRVQTFNGSTAADIDATTANPAFAYHASSSGSNRIAAYEQLSGAYGAAPNVSNREEVKDFIARQAVRTEIEVATSSGGAWSTTRLTQNAVGDIAPQTAVAANGRAAVVWKQGDVSLSDGQAMKPTVKGDLLISQYNGSTWSTPVAIASIDNAANDISEYCVAVAPDGSALVAAVRRPPTGSAETAGEIRLIAVAPDGNVKVVDAGYRGARPQLRTLGADYVLGFITPKDEKTDVYLVSLNAEGSPVGSLNGFANLSSEPVDFCLVTDATDVSLVWSGTCMMSTATGLAVETGLFAAKVGKNTDGSLYVSSPVKVMQQADDTRIVSFDARLSGNSMKTIATVADGTGGSASIVEAASEFSNKIKLENEYHASHKLAPGQFPFEFTISNTGYLPVTSVAVSMGSVVKTTATTLMPGKSATVYGLGDLTTDLSAPVNYSIEATFADNSKHILTGDLNLESVDLAVSVVSSVISDTKTTALLEVKNKSPFELNANYTVEIGIYDDLLATNLVAGTSVKTIAVADLYDGVKGNLSALVSFEIPNATETKSVYPIVKILNGNSPVADRAAEDNGTVLQLFGTGLAAPVINTATLPDATVSATYSATLDAASEAVVVWTLGGGELPTGLTLSPDGILSGTPTAAGTFNFTVKAENNGGTVTKSLTVKVMAATVYGISIGTFTGGSVSSSSVSAQEDALVTLTITPDPGYELNSITAYETAHPNNLLTLGGSGSTRTFTMPAYGITVTATFQKTQATLDAEAVAIAKSAIESHTYTVAQATAQTEAEIKAWLVGQMNDLIASTGIIVSASDITISNYSAPTNGNNGGFNFVVSLVKGNATGTASKTGNTITVTSVYTVTIAIMANGSVSADKTTLAQGETVTLTISPSAGYELDVITATKTGETTTVVTLTGSGDTRTFTMPAYDVTVNAIFKKRQAQLDKEAVEAAKAAIEGGIYRVAQATANDAANVKTWLKNTLNTLFGQSHGLQLRAATASIVGEITITDIASAIVGTESNPNGTDGSFNFTVALTLGETMLTTTITPGVIVATPYDVTPVKRIELLLFGNLELRIINTGNVATGTLSLTLSGENADVFTLPSTTVSSLPVGGVADIALTPRENLPEGTYTATLSVGGESITPVSVEITYTVTLVGIGDLQVEVLKAWIQNRMLHVSGLTPGKQWSVYHISGIPVYQDVASSDEADINLPVHGVYIVKSGKEIIKVVY